MSCLVEVDLTKVEVNLDFVNNEPGNDEYIFHVNVNDNITRHPASGNFSSPGFGTFLVNRNVFSQVVETDTVTIIIFARVVEDDTFFDDEAIAQLILKIPCQNPLSMSASFDAISYDINLLGDNATIGKMFFDIRIKPFFVPIP